MYLTILFLFSLLFHYEAQSLKECSRAFPAKKAEVQIETLNRLQFAEYLLNKSLSEKQKQAIITAHNIGKEEPGKDGSPAGIGNYTKTQLLKKARTLKQASFTTGEIKMLIKNRIVGFSGTGSLDMLKNTDLRKKRVRKHTNKVKSKQFELPFPSEVLKGMRPRPIEDLPSHELRNISLEYIEKKMSEMSHKRMVKLIARLKDMDPDQESRVIELLESNYLFLEIDRPPISKKLMQELIPYMEYLPPEQIGAIPPEMIAKIPPDLIKKISADVMPFITIEQINALTSKQKKALSSEQREALDL